MKLILAILRDEAVESISQALVNKQFRVTRIASTGGFLRRGSTTMIIGVENEQVQTAIQTMRAACPPAAADQKQVILFVLPVAGFEQL
jgi:uncharacterized protein YaaQ